MKKLFLIFLLTLWVNQIFAGGSRDFELDDTEYFDLQKALVTDYPMTFCCWFNAESLATSMTFVMIHDYPQPATNQYFLGLAADGADYKNVTCARDSTTLLNIGYNSVILNTSIWYFACSTFNTTNDRQIYTNQTYTNLNISIGTPTNIDRFYIGAFYRTPQGITNTTDGLLSEVACWNVALTNSQILDLSHGVPPSFVRPGKTVLKAYYPLKETSGNAIDMSGNSNTMTETSGTIASSSLGPPKLFIPIGGQ